MSATVFLTGGAGFVGQNVIDALVSRSYSVNALVNRQPIRSSAPGVRSFPGGLFDPDALDAAMKGCQAVVHIVGIIMEKPSSGVTFERIHTQGTRAVVDAARRAGIRRFVHMSALGSRANAVSRYHISKYAAEQCLRQSGLDWTIFRPSLIHGEDGEFMRMEAKWARFRAPPFVAMPYFGAGPMGRGGAGKLQPVFVKDVARAFVEALEKPQTVGEVYPLGGPDQLTWPQLHRACARAIVGRERCVLPLPAWYAKLLTYMAPRALLPFNLEQVIMSQEDNTTDMAKFEHDFGWRPAAFEPSLSTYASKL